MIPLVVRSAFSLLRGATTLDTLCRHARALGYTRLALTDRNNLYGLPEFLKRCRRYGLDPLIGAEITASAAAADPRARVICLVENAAGYRNLCRLITARQQDPAFDLLTAVARAAGPDAGGGLIVLAADPQRLAALHARAVPVAAMQPVGPRGEFMALSRLTARLHIPFVAVPDSFFAAAAEFPVHRVLRAIGLNTVLSRLPPAELAGADHWLADPAAYRQRFAVRPDLIAATHALAERCVFRGPSTQTIFPHWTAPDGRTAADTLRADAYAGARRRYGDDLSEAAVERLEHELRCITAKGFADYFLYVRDIVRRSPRICGRGSGAASIVAYSLGITNVCPLKFNLYFERFLNPQRIDPPDIDVDFAWDERDAVQLDVLAEYPGHVAMVCNHVLFQPRMAVREVAKVFGLPAAEIDRVTAKLPWYWRQDDIAALTASLPADGAPADLQTALEQLPELRQVRFPPPWREILQLARRLLGIPRHLSVHSGGVVITPQPVQDYVPIETAAKGVPIIHWEKDGTEELGLVKIDLLGNRSLAVIRDAIANLRAHGVAFDEARWQPEDDLSTQRLVAAGDTMGCFYVESPATRLLQQRTRVGDYAHLVIHSSIIRPAANDYIREYIRRLRGGHWEPLHPLLTDVLAETYGIMVYQEHVALTAMALADFSHHEADRLRKILSKKDKHLELADLRQQFVAGARRKQISDPTIDAIWNMILSFSGYSFCKPHSASYARVSFQAAYLKAHHPAEMLAAVLTNQGGFYSTFAYVSEARRRGLTILPPDVMHSAIRWTGRGDAIRVGLQAVKHLSAATAARILAERGEQHERPFTDFADFLQRVRPDETEARALIHAGAADGFLHGRDRVELLWALALRRQTAAADPPTLFPELAAADQAARHADRQPPPMTPTPPLEKLRRQFELLGFLCDRHPLALFRDVFAGRRLVPAVELPRHVGRRIQLAGWLITGKVVSTRAGQPMEFLTFEDETGLIETTLFPRPYARYCHMLTNPGPYVITGVVEEDFGVATLNVEHLELIAARRATPLTAALPPGAHSRPAVPDHEASA